MSLHDACMHDLMYVTKVLNVSLEGYANVAADVSKICFSCTAYDLKLCFSYFLVSYRSYSYSSVAIFYLFPIRNLDLQYLGVIFGTLGIISFRNFVIRSWYNALLMFDNIGWQSCIKDLVKNGITLPTYNFIISLDSLRGRHRNRTSCKIQVTWKT